MSNPVQPVFCVTICNVYCIFKLEWTYSNNDTYFDSLMHDCGISIDYAHEVSQFYIKSHHGLATPHSDIGLSQHWLR